VGECTVCGCSRPWPDDGPCIDCYTPKDPTFGWLLSEYRRRNMDDKALREHQVKTRVALDKFLRASLGFKETRKRRSTDVDGR